MIETSLKSVLVSLFSSQDAPISGSDDHMFPQVFILKQMSGLIISELQLLQLNKDSD